MNEIKVKYWDEKEIEAVPATLEEFEDIKKPGPPQDGYQRLSVQAQIVDAMDIDEVVRFKNHPHVGETSTNGTCHFARNLRRRNRIKHRVISMRHDGPDLLVKRVE